MSSGLTIYAQSGQQDTLLTTMKLKNDFVKGKSQMKNFLGKTMAALLIGSAANAADIQLPAPQNEGGMPLMQALNERKSIRQFGQRPIDMQTLSNILWAAYGVNRPDGGYRTIPTAKNERDLTVYITTPDGVWRYEAETNLLREISQTSLLDMFKLQDYMQDAQLVLIYTGSTADYAAMHAGSAYQNVGLYAASAGMSNVVRGYFQREEVQNALNLPYGQRVIISQVIGWAD